MYKSIIPYSSDINSKRLVATQILKIGVYLNYSQSIEFMFCRHWKLDFQSSTWHEKLVMFKKKMQGIKLYM